MVRSLPSSGSTRPYVYGCRLPGRGLQLPSHCIKLCLVDQNGPGAYLCVEGVPVVLVYWGVQLEATRQVRVRQICAAVTDQVCLAAVNGGVAGHLGRGDGGGGEVWHRKCEKGLKVVLSCWSPCALHSNTTKVVWLSFTLQRHRFSCFTSMHITAFRFALLQNAYTAVTGQHQEHRSHDNNRIATPPRTSLEPTPTPSLPPHLVVPACADERAAPYCPEGRQAVLVVTLPLTTHGLVHARLNHVHVPKQHEAEPWVGMGSTRKANRSCGGI